MPTQIITPPAERKIGEDIFHAVFPNSFDFRIRLPYSDAIDFIQLIGAYNNFEPGYVIDSLERIDRIIPRSYHGESNPNNGHRVYEVSVGRVGSPVIYLEWYEFSVCGDQSHWLSEQAMKSICLDMEISGRADDAYYRVSETPTGRKITFRFWWD